MQGGIKLANYKDVIDNAIERNMLIGNFIGDPLRIKAPIARSSAEIEYDEQLQELDREIKRVEKNRRDLVKRAAAEKADTKVYKEAVGKIDEELLHLTSKMQSMATGRNDFLDSIRRQSNLFASPSSSENSKYQGIHQIRKFKVSSEVRRIYKDYEVKIGERRLPKSMLGYFERRSKHVRVQSSFDILTGIHELTHALDDRHKIIEKIMKPTGMAKDGKPIYDPQYKEIRKLLTEQYIAWYPNAKETHRLEVRLKEGLAVTMEHYFSNRSLMNRHYKDVVDQLINKNGVIYNEDLMGILDRFTDIAVEYQSLSAEEVIGDALVDMDEERVSSGESVSRIGEFVTTVFNQFAPVQLAADKMKYKDALKNPYTWSPAFYHRRQHATNAIWGTATKGKQIGIIIPKQDGSFVTRDYSVYDVQKELKDENEIRKFNTVLVARRYIGEYIHRHEAEIALEEAQEKYERALEIAKQMMEEEGFVYPQAEKDLKDARNLRDLAKRDYDRISTSVQNDHGRSEAEIKHKIEKA